MRVRTIENKISMSREKSVGDEMLYEADAACCPDVCR